MRTFRAAPGLGLAVLLVSSLAQADADDATGLFNRGLADMQAHRFDTGCPALESSYEKEPHPGGLITLAECDYQWGKLALAREQYASFLDLVARMPRDEARKQAERAALATARRTELDRDVPIVTLAVSGGAPPGTTVSLDGDAPTPPGTARRVDPGHHVAHLLTPDGRTAAQELSVGKAENRIVVVGFDVIAPSSGRRAGPREPWFLTAVAVGATGIVAGAILGGVALADTSTVDAHCPSGGVCNTPGAVSTANTAVAVGWGSTAAFAVGLAGAGAALGLWLTRPAEGSKSGVAIVPVLVPPSPLDHSRGSLGVRIAF